MTKNSPYKPPYCNNRRVWHQTWMIMRLTAFLIIISTLSISAKSYSQKINLSLKDSPLATAFSQIRQQSGYSFLWTEQTLEGLPSVNVSVHDASLREALTACLQGLPLTYNIHGNVVFIERKLVPVIRIDPVVTALVPSLHEVTGTVTDSLGHPLVGASVQIKGTTQGTITDASGHYELNASPNSILIFSNIGYQNKEVSIINGGGTLNVTLSAANTGLNEVIVVGYGTQKRADITGSVATVNVNRLTDIPVDNLSNGLAGRITGVNISSVSGLAGASSSISVRGSFNDPLYVIDGIIKSKSDFDALDPNEIANISVLKDAAAASIYGAQAGNGVVVVTTKRGSIGKPTFSFQVSTTTQRPTQTMLSELSNATDELTYENRVTEFNNEYNNQNVPLPNGPTEFDYFKNRSYDLNNWIWRNPATQKYLFSVEGGTDKITYYNMVSYTDETGSYKNLDYKKFNVRSNISAKVSNSISVDLNIGAAEQNTDRFYWPFNGSDNLEDYDVTDFYRTTFNWPKYVPPYVDAEGTPAKPGEVTPYPILPNYSSWLGWSVADVVLGGGRSITARNRQFNPTLTINVKLDQLVKGLSTKFVGNFQADDYFEKDWLNYSTSYVFLPAPGQSNPFLPAPPSQTNVFAFNDPQAPYLSEHLNTGWQYQIDWFLNYDRTFGQNTIHAMGVFEQTQNKLFNVTSTAYDPIGVINQYYAYSTSNGNRYGTGNEGVAATQAWIGRVHYDYAGRYIAEFSFREDGQYELAPGHQWGFFPSGSVAWLISQESFFQNAVPWVNILKLRGSYGTTGNLFDVNNNPIEPFQYQTYYAPSSGYAFGTPATFYPGITPTASPNPNITWATTIGRDLGLDFTLLQNRLSSTFDIYQNTMKNILGAETASLPTTFGQALAPQNYAQRTFHGWEFSLQWQDKIGQVQYSVNGNMGYAIDRWDKLDQNPLFMPGGAASFENRVGQPSGLIFGLQAEGLIRNQGQLKQLVAEGYNYQGRKPYLGAILYKDVRGQNFSSTPDNTIDGNDIVLLSKNGIPRINYGFGLGASWKGLRIDALFQGVLDYERMVGIEEGAGIWQWGGTQRLYFPLWAHNVYTPETPNGKYPRPVGQLWEEAGDVASSFWLRNGAYLRLKNLNISYNLPMKWMRGARIQNAQVFVNGTNLLTFSAMKEFMDPEMKEYDSYPIMKTFTVGLNVKF